MLLWPVGLAVGKLDPGEDQIELVPNLTQSPRPWYNLRKCTLGPCGKLVMTISVEATFENGAFKPLKPVSLPDGTPVHLEVSPVDTPFDPLEAVIGIGEGPPEGDGAENHDKYIYGKIMP